MCFIPLRMNKLTLFLQHNMFFDEVFPQATGGVTQYEFEIYALLPFQNLKTETDRYGVEGPYVPSSTCVSLVRQIMQSVLIRLNCVYNSGTLLRCHIPFIDHISYRDTWFLINRQVIDYFRIQNLFCVAYILSMKSKLQCSVHIHVTKFLIFLYFQYL